MKTEFTATKSAFQFSSPWERRRGYSHFGIEVRVPNQASATARARESDCVSRLARFFPDATPVRIPIRLSRASDDGDTANANDNSGNMRSPWREIQETVIEFGTPHEVLFVLAHPVEFADRVLIESRDGSLHAEASVVAVQYHAERTVVGARFLNPVPNWIVK
jgi:hypothetical protein